MKTKFLNVLIAGALSLIATGSLTHLVHNNIEKQAVQVEAAEGDYYSSITDSMSGTTLLDALHTLNNTKRKKTIGYAGMRTFAKTSDADPDGSGKIIGFYDNAKVGPDWDGGSTWNREHVWPNVRNGNLVEDDAHMVRPAATSTNSDRGSKGFGTDSYDPGKTVPYYRGAAARIIFYAAIADTSLTIVDFPFNYNGVGNGNSGYPVGSMGSLSDMLKWNLQYQPSDTSFTGANDIARRTEINRNEKIQNASGGQGNRNPFIDHPEYACKIWGNTNETTKAICSGQLPPDGGETPQIEDLVLNETEKTLEIGESFDLIATSKNNAQIKWTFEENAFYILDFDKTVTASGEALTLTAAGNGTTIITATANGKTATCRVICGNGGGESEPEQPNQPEQPSQKTRKGCGGSITAAGIITPLFAISGIALLVYKKRKRK